MSDFASSDREKLPRTLDDLIETHGSDCYEVGFQDALLDDTAADKARDDQEKSYGALRNFLAALQLENERLKETALTEIDRMGVMQAIDDAIRITDYEANGRPTPEEKAYLERLIELQRRISSVSNSDEGQASK